MEEVSTTGEMTALQAETDIQKVKIGQLVQIEISARDREGHLVPDACPEITCSVEGPARLVGMDAGDLTDLSLFSSPRRRMFNGLLLAAVMPEREGEVKIVFTSGEGLQESVVLKI